jgi:hypothetical protein
MIISKQDALIVLRKFSDESTEVWCMLWGPWGSAAFSGRIEEASIEQIVIRQGRLKSTFKIGGAGRFQWGDERDVSGLSPSPGELTSLMMISLGDVELIIGDVEPKQASPIP